MPAIVIGQAVGRGGLLVAGVASGSLEPFQVSPDHHGGGGTLADGRGELLGAARADVARGEYPG